MHFRIEIWRRLQRNWRKKKTIANNSKSCCLDLSIRIHACNAIRYTSVILPGSFVTLSPWGPGNRMSTPPIPVELIKVSLTGPKPPTPQAHIPTVMAVTPSTTSQIQLHSFPHSDLDVDPASSVRYTSVILFTVLWDPRGPRITPAFGLWPCKFNPLYFRYAFHCALGSAWATNHPVILSAQLNWNTSATELAQKKKLLRKLRWLYLVIMTIWAGRSWGGSKPKLITEFVLLLI